MKFGHLSVTLSNACEVIKVVVPGAMSMDDWEQAAQAKH